MSDPSAAVSPPTENLKLTSHIVFQIDLLWLLFDFFIRHHTTALLRGVQWKHNKSSSQWMILFIIALCRQDLNMDEQTNRAHCSL